MEVTEFGTLHLYALMPLCQVRFFLGCCWCFRVVPCVLRAFVSKILVAIICRLAGMRACRGGESRHSSIPLLRCHCANRSSTPTCCHCFRVVLGVLRPSVPRILVATICKLAGMRACGGGGSQCLTSSSAQMPLRQVRFCPILYMFLSCLWCSSPRPRIEI